MAENVLKLKVQSEEYDAKIKRAAEGIQHFVKDVRESGSTLKEQGILARAFLKELGNMETVAKGGKQQLREMSNALVTLTDTYRGLSDAEKSSGFGQELNKQIQILTERAGQMQDAMADVQQSITNAASDTRTFDQIAGGMQAATAGFQTVTGAAKLMGIQMGDDVEVIAKLQAAMAVTSGFQTMQNMLQKQSALMQGVNALQKEFNILANANPYVLLATAAAAVVAAYVAWTSGARDAEKAQKALNGEIEATRTQLSQIDKDTDFSVGVAEAAGKSWKAIHELRLEAARTKLQLADMNYDKLAASGVASAEQMKKAAEMQQQAWDNVMKVLNEGTIHEIKMRNGNGKGKGSKGTTAEKTEEQLNNAQIEKLSNEYIKATDERRQAIEKEIKTLQDRNAEIQKLKDMAMGKGFDAGQLNGEVLITGRKSVANDKTFREAPTNFDSINTWVSGIKDQLKTADLGSDLYNSLTEKIKDATTVSTLLQEMMERGLAGADLETTAQALKEKLLSPEGIDQTAIQSFLDELNKQIEEAGGVGLKLNADTGEVTDDKGKDKGYEEEQKKFNEGIGKLTGGLSQVAGGLKSIGIDIPKEVDEVIGVINGVSQIISGVGTIISVFGTTAITANTTAVGLNTAAIAGLIAAIEVNTATNFIPFFAGGGIVPAFAQGGLIGRAAGGMMIPGNSLSGDRLRLPVDGGLGMIGVNSGELILNRAQQGNLASQLEGGGIGNLHLDTVIRGEDIRLVLNNNGRRTGRGEYVQSRNSRG